MTYPIANTFGLPATADDYFEYRSEEELRAYLATGALQTPYLHVGAGSNLLFLNHFAGTVLHSCIRGVEVMRQTPDTVDVRVGAGEIWDEFTARCAAMGWYGAENLTAIPGEVGAAAVQNIGAYGVEIKDLIQAVETIDVQGQSHCFTASQCAYGYRTSVFKQPGMKHHFITRVHLRLGLRPAYRLDYGTLQAELAHQPLNLDTVRRVIADVRWRKLPHPEQWGNAGSFFMNPVVSRAHYQSLVATYPQMPHYELGPDAVKIPAAWLIEQCGWKGRALGQAAVYRHQALVLINLGQATAHDIVALSQAIQADVKRRFDIQIKPEVNFI